MYNSVGVKKQIVQFANCTKLIYGEKSIKKRKGVKHTCYLKIVKCMYV